VAIHLGTKTVRIGMDDVEGLLQFLKSRVTLSEAGQQRSNPAQASSPFNNGWVRGGYFAAMRRRRMCPPRPVMPMPTAAIVRGSGTV